MGKAIEAKFECKSCGNLLSKQTIINTTQKKNKYSFNAPSKCTCGASSEHMELISFDEMESLIIAKSELEKINRVLGE